MKLNQSTLSCTVLVLLLPAGGCLPMAGPSPAASSDKPGAAPVPNRPLPAITVEAAYPGADAQVLAETVAFPIEQQVNGLEGIRHMTSRCTSGAYTLHIAFEPGIDLTLAQALVHERVNLAVPLLPGPVKGLGLTVKKRSPGPLLFVTLSSPDSSHDSLYLGNYASIHIKDELSRLSGVGSVSLFGASDFGVRIWLDPGRLAARGLTAGDVVRSLREQNVEVPAAQTGQAPVAPGQARPFTFTINNLGRLASVDTIADIVLKTRADGGLVRLKDLARVELGAGPARGTVCLDGKPAVALGIFPTPQARPDNVRTAVRNRMERLKETFPPGIDYSIAFELRPNADAKSRPTTPRYLLAEPILPDSITAERAVQLIERCSAILMRSEGVRHVLVLSENPFARFHDEPCLLAMLAQTGQGQEDQERVTPAIRTRLDQVEGVPMRLFDVAWPSGYPLDLAIRGPNVDDVKELAEKLIERLAGTKKLTDLSAAPPTGTKQEISIDASKAAKQGVLPADIAATLEAYLGPVVIADSKSFGRGWQVQLQVDTAAREMMDGIKRLKVRNTQGQMVSLANLVTLRQVKGPVNIDRLDFQPMAAITANRAPGVSLAEARWLCETLADDVRKGLGLGPEYSLVWMRELPPAKPVPGTWRTVAVDAPPPEVVVCLPVARAVTDYENFTGRIHAAATVELRARVTGYLEKALFKDGAQVKQGDLLFQIDPRPYQADLNLAYANLKQAEGERALQEKAVARLKKLITAGAVAKEEYDQALAALDKARATIAAMQAAAERARLTLDSTRVAAPITGRISRCQVDPGNLITADTTLLATIVSQDPMYVYFDMDETTLLRLMRLSREAKAKPRADGQTPALLALPDEDGFPRQGIVNFVDNRVNADTGTIQARAVFPNADGMLVPGLFARIRLPLGAPRQALLVPEEAVLVDQGVKLVYVVDDQNKVVFRRVQVGAAHDALRVIEEGLKPNERVITSGGKRLKPGMTVKPKMVDPPVQRP
jgi:RND family efflux transporter MFP subunit